MAQEDFEGVAVAVGVQADFGTPHADVPDLDHTGSPSLADGYVLGDAESGDAESGITIPNIVGIHRDVASVAGSWTESADAFLKAEITGFSVSWVMQGNGVTAANPISTNPGEASIATIMPGVDAILQCSGLVAANGTTPVVEYTPRDTTIYSTWKLWHGDLAFVFSDCLVESLAMEFTPGGLCVMTSNISVGTFDATTEADGFTFPTIDYEEMADFAGPTVEGVGFSAFNHVRGFENLTVTIANPIEKFLDSNVDVTGERQAQNSRIISASGTLYVSDANSDAAFGSIRNTVAPTNDLFLQVGDVTIADGDYNSFKVSVNNLQAKDIKYNRVGDGLVVELNDSKATALAAGGEFKLTLN